LRRDAHDLGLVSQVVERPLPCRRSCAKLQVPETDPRPGYQRDGGLRAAPQKARKRKMPVRTTKGPAPHEERLCFSNWERGRARRRSPLGPRLGPGTVRAAGAASGRLDSRGVHYHKFRPEPTGSGRGERCWERALGTRGAACRGRPKPAASNARYARHGSRRTSWPRGSSGCYGGRRERAVFSFDRGGVVRGAVFGDAYAGGRIAGWPRIAAGDEYV